MFRGNFKFILFLVLATSACHQHKSRVYVSECTNGVSYKTITYRHLLDSLNYYNNQYVQVTGKYAQGKYLSALVNDSTFTNHDAKHSFWVNFTPDCPLYDPNTHVGLFQSENGEYQTFNNKEMVIRARLELHHVSKTNPYKATLNEVIYVQLK